MVGKTAAASHNATGSGLKGGRLLALLLLSTVLGGVRPFGGYEAHAQQAANEAVSFQIPAQPLSSAIDAFIRQSGWQISYSSALVYGKTSPGVSGNLAPAEALQRLVAGTGISVSIGAPRSAALVDPVSAAVDLAEDGSVMLGTIVIGGGQLGSNDLTYESSGSVSYISGEEIDQRRGSSVGDFLAGTPGVMNGDNRNSGSLDVNVRGMQGQGRVPVVIDGASNENTVYRGYNGAAARSYVDPDFISDVVIEKGPSSSPDATGATGGIVRMSTIGVKDILLPGQRWGFRVKTGLNTNSSSVPEIGTDGGLRWGRHNNADLPSSIWSPHGMNRPGLLEPTGGSASIAFAWTSDMIDFVAAYAARKNGNYHAGNHGRGAPEAVPTSINSTTTAVEYDGLSPFRYGEEVLNTSTDNRSILLKTTIRPADGHSIELGFSRYDSDFGEIMPTQIWGVGGYPSVYQAHSDTILLDTYTARYRWNPSDSDLIDLKADVFSSKLDSRINSAVRTSTEVFFPQYYYTDSHRTGITISNTANLKTTYGDIAVSFGGAYQEEKIGLPKGFIEDPDLMAGLGILPRIGSRKESSFFVSGDWRPAHWISLAGGLRYSDYRTYDERWRWAGNSILPGENPSTRSGNGWSPSASITLSPSNGVSLYGKYALATRMPSIFEGVSGFSMAGADISIDPETARHIEIGANIEKNNFVSSGDRLRIHAAYFEINVDKYITRSQVKTPIPSRPDRFTYTYGPLNLDYARMRGFELAVDYENGNFFGNFSWNRYTHTMFCARDDGTVHNQVSVCGAGGIRSSYTAQHIPPKDTVSVNLGYKMFDEKLILGSRLTYVGRRAVDGFGNSDSIGPTEIRTGHWKPYTLVDIFASYDINEIARIDFAIDNLTDRYYLDGLSSSLMPSPGRTVRVNFTKRF